MAEAFTRLAKVFDELMSDVDYIEWVDYVEDLFNLANRDVHEILDLACGTGIPTKLFEDKGYKLVGIDKSIAMLKVAKRKVKAHLIAGDAKSFHLRKKFDAVISLFDSMNYLLKPEELIDTFKNVRSHLYPGGVFIFDMNTLKAFKDYWGDDIKVKETQQTVSIWRTTFDEGFKISTLHITVFYKNRKGWKRIDETHMERGYRLDEVEGYLYEAGFTWVELFHHLTLRRATENSLRFTAVARC